MSENLPEFVPASPARKGVEAKRLADIALLPRCRGTFWLMADHDTNEYSRHLTLDIRSEDASPDNDDEALVECLADALDRMERATVILRAILAKKERDRTMACITHVCSCGWTWCDNDGRHPRCDLCCGRTAVIFDEVVEEPPMEFEDGTAEEREED